MAAARTPVLNLGEGIARNVSVVPYHLPSRHRTSNTVSNHVVDGLLVNPQWEMRLKTVTVAIGAVNWLVEHRPLVQVEAREIWRSTARGLQQPHHLLPPALVARGWGKVHSALRIQSSGGGWCNGNVI